MNRKIRFWVGLFFIVLVFSLPLTGFAFARAYWYLGATIVCFMLSIGILHKVTVKNVKLKYPLVNPEGHADIYSGRMPRPIYEDIRRFPWFFNKKKHAEKTRKKRKVREKR